MSTVSERQRYLAAAVLNKSLLLLFRQCFWATVCKTVRPAMLSSVVCLSVLFCLSVCDVGVLWPNGWMDQDVTWYGGRPRPRPQCVRWGASYPLPKRGTAPNFGGISIVAKRLDGHVPLGTKVGVGPGDIVLDGDLALPQKGAQSPIFGPCLLWSNGWIDQDATCYGDRPRPKPHCVRREPSPLQKGHISIVARVAHLSYC